MNLQLCKNLKEEKTLKDYITVKVIEAQLQRTYLNQTTKEKNVMVLQSALSRMSQNFQCSRKEIVS